MYNNGIIATAQYNKSRNIYITIAMNQHYCNSIITVTLWQYHYNNIIVTLALSQYGSNNHTIGNNKIEIKAFTGSIFL